MNAEISNQLLNCILGFKNFGCSPKEALKQFTDMYEFYSNQLKDIGATEEIIVIEDFLIDKFQEEFPDYYSEIDYTLNRLAGEILDELEGSKRYLKEKESIAFQKKIVETYYSMIAKKFGGPLPDVMTKPFVSGLYKMLESWSKGTLDLMPGNKKAELKSFYEDFILSVVGEIVTPFAKTTMKVSIDMALDMFMDTISAMGFNLKEVNSNCVQFFNKKGNCLFETIKDITDSLKEYMRETPRINLLFEHLLDLKTEEVKDASTVSIFNICNYIKKLEISHIMYFSASFFLVLSGFYRNKRFFKEGSYDSSIREAARRVIKAVHNRLKETRDKSELYISFQAYKIFEQVLGEILFQNNPKAIKETLFDILLKAQCDECKAMISASEFLSKLARKTKLINLTPDRHSVNVIICVSGFLSKGTDKLEEWNNLLLAEKESMIYAIDWPSSNNSKIVKRILTTVEGLTIDFVNYYYLGWTHLFPVKLSVDVVKEVDKFKDLFTKIEKKAAALGKLLPHIIHCCEEFKGKAVSLVGFSLGCRVLFHCIKEYARIAQDNEVFRPLSNVLLMGGAMIMKSPKDSLWEKRFNVVAGRIINAYSEGNIIYSDWALKIFAFIKKKSEGYPIGINRLIFKDNTNRVENFNVKDTVSGHSNYRSQLQSIIKIISFE